MSLWRIRIIMPDDPHSHALLTAAIAEQRVWALLRSPHDTDMTGDVIIELPGDAGPHRLAERTAYDQPGRYS